MVPLPGPLPPETMLIQEALGVALHAQPAAVVTVMSCDGLPDASKVRLPGATEYVHPFAWVTAKVSPPIVMLALRAGPVLADTVKLMFCVPVPFAGTPVTQDGTPLLVQSHPAVAVISNELGPPPAGAEWLLGFSE